jgi:hypothetical protein
MTPTDRAEFEALTLTEFFAWLEPENIDRVLELAREKDCSLFEPLSWSFSECDALSTDQEPLPNRSRKVNNFFASADWSGNNDVKLISRRDGPQWRPADKTRETRNLSPELSREEINQSPLAKRGISASCRTANSIPKKAS